MNADFNLYRIFLYLYEEGSISKTAAKLFVSQPAISYSLKELETQLGYTLFYRNSKGIEPTTEAKELYSYVSTAFHLLKDAEEHINNLKELNTGCIRIGISSFIGSSFLSTYIMEFHKKYPNISFEIISKSNEEMMKLLEIRKLDMVLDTSISSFHKDVSKITLRRLQTCFAYHRNYMGKRIHSILDLSKSSVLLPNVDSSFGNKIIDNFRKKHLDIVPVFETDSIDTMIEYVREGMGIGCFYQEYLEKQYDFEQFRVFEFEDNLPKIDLFCFTVDSYLTTAASKFIELLKEK
ncbi:MAG: LysR family transcriptional regulator [Bacilli bacterium]|nr:LysR family transcriptional regulator [Bacilli bacterium]